MTDLAELGDDELNEAYLAHMMNVEENEFGQWMETYKALRDERARRFDVSVLGPRARGEAVRPEWCICDDGFWLRGRDDPRCRHDDMEELHDRIAGLESDNENDSHFDVHQYENDSHFRDDAKVYGPAMTSETDS